MEDKYKDFYSGRLFYYITPKGKIREEIIHSGISPKSAYTLSKIFVLYDNWTEANEALKELNEIYYDYFNK